MEERKSFATFTDGHTEEILYFEKYDHATTLFVTKSGVYICRPNGITGVTEFYRIHSSGIGPALVASEEDTIRSIRVDERVKVHFILGDEEGDVLVPPNATDDQIKLAILDTILDFSYEKVED